MTSTTLQRNALQYIWQAQELQESQHFWAVEIPEFALHRKGSEMAVNSLEQGLSQALEEASFEQSANAKGDHVTDHYSKIHDAQDQRILATPSINSLGHIRADPGHQGILTARQAKSGREQVDEIAGWRCTLQKCPNPICATL